MVSVEELRRIVGDLDDARIVAILALNPTVAEAEEAALWAGRQGDVPIRQGRILEGKVALIFDILARAEEEEDATRR